MLGFTPYHTQVFALFLKLRWLWFARFLRSSATEYTMFILLIGLSSHLVFADMAPPKNCPTDTYRYKREFCIKNGYTPIYLRSVLPKEYTRHAIALTAQLSKTLVIPGLNDFTGSSLAARLDVKEEEKERVEVLLRNFFNSHPNIVKRQNNSRHARQPSKRPKSTSIELKQKRTMLKNAFLYSWNSSGDNFGRVVKRFTVVFAEDQCSRIRCMSIPIVEVPITPYRYMSRPLLATSPWCTVMFRAWMIDR